MLSEIESSNASTVIGVGVIGGGGICREHAAAVAYHGSRARLIGIADLDAMTLRQAAIQSMAPLTFLDHKELLAREDIDVVVIATPPSVHEPLLKDALSAGKIVVCEKPIAPTLEGIDRIEAIANDYPNKLTTVYQFRYCNESEQLRWVMEQGGLGDIKIARIARISSTVPTAWWGRWSIAGGGAVMTQFIHHLDQIIYLFGRPVSVSARMDTIALDLESEDTFEATVSFESGVEVNCAGSVAGQGLSVDLHVEGQRGSYDADSGLKSNDSALASRYHNAFPAPPPPPRPPGRIRRILSKVLPMLRARRSGPPPEPMLGRYYDHLFTSIEQGKPLPIDLSDARASIDLCMGIYSSGLRGGETVELPLNRGDAVYQGMNEALYAQRPTPAEFVDPQIVTLQEKHTANESKH